VPDLGEPSSYLTLEPGAAVYSSDGEKVGTVDRVVADTVNDIFEGLVVDTSILLGKRRFVDAEQVDQIYDHGVQLEIDRRAADSLPDAPD
jgi:uncharacterized protein YrrD